MTQITGHEHRLARIVWSEQDGIYHTLCPCGARMGWDQPTLSVVCPAEWSERVEAA